MGEHCPQLDQPRRVPRNRLRWTALWPAIALWLLAALVFYALIPNPAFFDKRYGIARLYDGTAHNPFARRILAPSIVRLGVGVVPIPVRSVIDKRLAATVASRGGRPEHGTVVVVAALLTVVSAMMFLAIVALGFQSLGASRLGAVLLSLLTVPLLHVFTNFSVFVYDHLVLAIFAVATLWLWQRCARSPIFDAVVGVAALAKETAILLPIAAFAVDVGAIGPRLGRLSRRLALVAVIQACVVWSVSDRLGDPVEVHIRENIEHARHLGNWFAFEFFDRTVLFSRGLPFGRPVGFNLLVWVPLLLLAALGAGRDRRLGIIFLVMAVPLVLLQFAFGIFNEVRNFYELLPSVIWLASLGALRLVTRSRSAEERTGGTADSLQDESGALPASAPRPSG